MGNYDFGETNYVFHKKIDFRIESTNWNDNYCIRFNFYADSEFDEHFASRTPNPYRILAGLRGELGFLTRSRALYI